MVATKSNIDSIIGANVKIFLMVRGQSQTALGRQLGLQRSTMSMKIRGRISWTAADILGTSEFLKVPVQRLFDAAPINRFRKDFATELA